MSSMKIHNIMWALSLHSIRIRWIIRGPVKHPPRCPLVPSGKTTDLEKSFSPLPLKATLDALSFFLFLGFPFMNITNIDFPFSPAFESKLSKARMPGHLCFSFLPPSWAPACWKMHLEKSLLAFALGDVQYVAKSAPAPVPSPNPTSIATNPSPFFAW